MNTEFERPKKYQDHILTPKRYGEYPRHFYIYVVLSILTGRRNSDVKVVDSCFGILL